MGCASDCCVFIVIFALIYFIGFNNLLDFVVTVTENIPLIGRLITFLFSLLSTIISYIPFYWLYVVLICGLNIAYQLFFESSLRRTFRQNQISEVLYIMALGFVLPTAISLFLINSNLVVYLFMPFHLALMSFHIRNINGPFDYNVIRNFVLLVLAMPIITGSTHFVEYCIKSAAMKVHDL